ncbi:MAG: hypothetical protein B6D44_10180 [Ignavibacteriales bacterium UTCHB2]|jgi:hypothetical protein|nr:MAG: hypothetical protein B6D44_10180 [Ignavibacteriales bacterium UTCHB2]
MEKERYKILLEELIDNYFSNEKFIQQRETLEKVNKDDEYKKYVIKKFKNRTPVGWLKYIANKERTSSINNIKKDKLPPEIEIKALKRLNDTTFEETQPGIETKLNIKVFEELYISDKKEKDEKDFNLAEYLNEILEKQQIEPEIEKLRDRLCDHLCERIDKLPLTEFGKGYAKQIVLINLYDTWQEDENGNLTYGLITKKQLEKYANRFSEEIRSGYAEALEKKLKDLDELGTERKLEKLIEYRNRIKNLQIKMKFIKPKEEYAILDLNLGLVESEIENTREKNKNIEGSRKKLQAEILRVRKRIKKLVLERKKSKGTITKLQKDLETLKREFNKDVTEFPKNLKLNIKAKKEEIAEIQSSIDNIEKEIWGILGKSEGIFWKLGRLVQEFKKHEIDETELFDELNGENIKWQTDKLENKIEEKLKKYRIYVNEEEMLDLKLEVLEKKISNGDAWYDEITDMEETDENYDKEIDEVLKSRYNIYNETEEYPVFDYDFEKIKEYARQLKEEDRYRYYLRMQIEIKRVLNSFAATEFKNFDGNIYFGLKEFKESVDHILKKEKCPELKVIVDKQINTLKENASEKNFSATLTYIDMDIMLENNRLVKTNELIGYEIEYLEKLLGKNVGQRVDQKKEENEEKANAKQDKTTEKKIIPIKGLKKLAMETCELLIKAKVIKSVLEEKKSDKAITNILIPEIEKEYTLTIQNKKSLHDYFRQGQLILKNDKIKGLIILDTYPRKKKL